MTDDQTFAAEMEAVQQERIEDELRKRVFSLQESLADKQRDIGALKSQMHESTSELQAALTELSLFNEDYTKRPRWMLKGDRKRKAEHGSLVALFSDAHYGEVVRSTELGGYNSYNMAIAERRTAQFFEKSITVARRYLAGVDYDGIVLVLDGDIVSGDIHEELEQTNELSTYEIIAEVVPWLAEGIEYWARELGSVHVVSAPGNHGRDSRKPRHKLRSAHNADSLIGKLVARELRANDKVTFNVPDSLDVDFNLYGYQFSCEHGDNMRFSGVSEIGALGPVKRGTLRKTKKRLETGAPFKYLLLGHFHQYVPAHTQGFIMNGSLKGYDEYANSWNFTPEPPQQALFLVTPEHGIVATTSVILK